MNDVRSQLNAAWAVLTRPDGPRFNAFPLALAAGVDIRAAIDATGLRHLLIAGDDSARLESSTGVLSVEFGPLVFGGVKRQYLNIWCSEPTLNVEFHEVAVDIVDAVATDPEPVGAAVAAIDRWRRLFRTGVLSSMRESERIGLFAELSILIALNGHGSAVPAAAWTGPLRQPHDFELDDRCLEVKGIGHGSTTIRVHGFDQLDIHDAKPLHLALAVVESDPAGESIADLVTRLHGLLAGDGDLADRLNLARINLVDPILRSSLYTTTSLFLVDVGERVPRIVESSFVGQEVPAGVDRVSYEVEIAELLTRARTVSMTDPKSWWSA
ncbi:PD-(D/E)XK motif protein [Angustibacter sp. McL0619]|uniref:PD-(D/E)XK motif protein n=1 Tax=Angustibacter sp. McL0619 TaxID=3415676 RepID=UPI003CF45D80